MYAHVDLKAVGGEEGLATALLVAHKRVFSSVCLLVCAQVACRAVGSGAALKHALVPLHLRERDTERETQTETERDRERHRDRERERERTKGWMEADGGIT